MSNVGVGIIKSPWVLHFDAGSCNGCDIEILAALSPRYDVERFGIVNKGNPKFADVLLVTGTATARSKPILKALYDQMPEPKYVIAIGACACGGSVFYDCYNVEAGVDKVIPVTAYVPGCAARPQAIIDAVVAAFGLIQKLAAAQDGTAAAEEEEPEEEEEDMKEEEEEDEEEGEEEEEAEEKEEKKEDEEEDEEEDEKEKEG